MPDPIAISPYLPSRRATLAEGQPISELMARALDNPGLISLAAGFVDGQTLPVEIVREVTSDLLGNDSEARAMLQYGATPGLPALRRSILEQCTASNNSQET
ncbi:MAG TPA: hypothetical protein P5307_20275, partial [Pirellulaceae bacterium]|nr:hypothetical protein [Pirellulaceae bacterium]